MEEYIEILKILSSGSKMGEDFLDILNQDLSLPNIPLPTMGGEVWWTDMVSANGWRIQQNMFTHHARILDENNVRKAWGSLNGMYKALDNLVANLHRYDKSSGELFEIRSCAMEELKKLKELFDLGILSENEYEEKRMKILNEI